MKRIPSRRGKLSPTQITDVSPMPATKIEKRIRCHCTLGVDYVTLQIGALLDPLQEDHAKQLARWTGDLLRNLRNRRGICQSQIARLAAGMDRSYLSKAENGLALLPLSKLLPLAQALGLTEVILRFEGTKSCAVPKPSCRR